MGFAHAAVLDFAEIGARINKLNINPHLEVTLEYLTMHCNLHDFVLIKFFYESRLQLDLTNENLTIETCADTFQTILHLLSHISATFDASDKK